MPRYSRYRAGVKEPKAVFRKGDNTSNVFNDMEVSRELLDPMVTENGKRIGLPRKREPKTRDV